MGNFLSSGVLLGLAAALGWGVADFLARFATRRAGAYRTLMYMQLAGFLALSAGMAATGHFGKFFPSHVEHHVWAWAICAGLLNVGSAFSLYRSFEIGVLTLVAPIAASYPVLTVLLSLWSGERLTLPRAFGIIAAVVGVMLAVVSFSSPPPESSAEDHRRHVFRGVPWALAAAVGFGLLFWVLGFHVMPVFSGAASVWIVRITTFTVLALLVIPVRQDAKLPVGSTLWLIVAVGVLDTAAFVANNLALKNEQVAVASVLSSLYGAVTVVLAAIFLRDKLERTQWAGIVLIFLGIALVSV
ncbi:MAG: EamA family transporter [Candidatus Acidiferrales bacterium]